jgi:hypothetical protein
MPYDPNVCLEKLEAAGLTPVCGGKVVGGHCGDLVMDNPAIHAFCSQVGSYYTPVQALACTYYSNGTPTQWQYWTPDKLITNCLAMQPQRGTGNTGWQLAVCYCCCSCFAYNTMVAVPDGEVAIQEIAAGNTVRSAALDKSGKPVWSESVVTFSSGVDGGHHPFMVYVNHGDDARDLVCNPDQIFALASGKLVRAEQLRLGDQLMGEDGNPTMSAAFTTSPPVCTSPARPTATCCSPTASWSATSSCR